MKVLLSFNGLIRNFEKCFKNIEQNLMNNNENCSFDFIFNTSDFDNQISNRRSTYSHNFKCNTDITFYFNNILQKYNNNIKEIIFENPKIEPGVPFNRIVSTYKTIISNRYYDYDYILFMRFDIELKEVINFKLLKDDTLYFFDGKTSNWFCHNKDMDYALLGNYKTLDQFLFYNIEYNYKFYSGDVINFMRNNNEQIMNILNIYNCMPFNSRWKYYNEREKNNTVKIYNNYNNNRINGYLEKIIFALYCKKLYDSGYKIDILAKVDLEQTTNELEFLKRN